MQISKFLSLSFSFVLFCSAAQAQMQQFGALEADLEALKEDVRALPVSYTHLTLPTIGG